MTTEHTLMDILILWSIKNRVRQKFHGRKLEKKTYSRVTCSAKIDKNQTVPREHSLELDLEDDLDNDLECLDLLRQCKK